VASTPTSHFAWNKPAQGDADWGTTMNDNLDDLDTTLFVEHDADGKHTKGVTLIQSTDDVADPPTDDDLDTAFGTPAALGAGFVGTLDDNSGDADCYLCWTSDTSWYYVKGTKALAA
jgi:hypothetical protein